MLRGKDLISPRHKWGLRSCTLKCFTHIFICRKEHWGCCCFETWQIFNVARILSETKVKISRSQKVLIGIIHMLIGFQAMKFMEKIHHSRLSRILFNIKDARTEQRWNPNTRTSSGLLSPSTSSIMLFTAIIIPSSGVLLRLQIIPSGLSISYRQWKNCLFAEIVIRFVSFANRTDSPAENKSLRSWKAYCSYVSISPKAVQVNTWPPQVCTRAPTRSETSAAALTRHCWRYQRGALFLHKCPADAEPRIKTSPVGQGIHLGSYISWTQVRLRPLRTGIGHPCWEPLVVISINYSSFISNASQSNRALQQVTTVTF